MNEFEFTFKVGDTFKHTYKSIEGYVQKSVKRQEGFLWTPAISIQFFTRGRTATLQEEFKWI